MDRAFANGDWQRYAAYYDSLNELRPYAEMLSEIPETLRGARYPLLDAGCGTGNLLALLEKRRMGPLVGIDGSHAMLERAKKKCLMAQFKRADLDAALTFGNGAFGTIVCVNTLYALANPLKTLGEFYRVLRPGGSLVIATPKSGYENGLILKSHAGSLKPDRYWQNAHASARRERLLVREAIRDRSLAARFLCIARFNRMIARERSFRFFTKEELWALTHESSFTDLRIKETYAAQNLLLTAKRDDTRSVA